MNFLIPLLVPPNLKMSNREHLRLIADVLDRAPRSGVDEDIPEGVRVIQISDTLARVISERLRKIAEEIK